MLTRRRIEALREIAAFIEREGYPPSRTEIGRAVGVTRQMARKYVAALLDDGLVSVDVNYGIEPTPAGVEFLRARAAHQATAGVDA